MRAVIALVVDAHPLTPEGFAMVIRLAEGCSLADGMTSERYEFEPALHHW